MIPAVLAVEARNTVTVVGSVMPVFTCAFSGFVNGDTAAVLTGAPTLTTTASDTSVVGIYPITVSVASLSAVNYTFSPVNGILNITDMGSVVITIGNNGDGTVTLSFRGLPGATYIVQAASALTPAANWSNISTNFAGSSGTFTITNAITGPTQLFRAVEQ